MSVTLQEAGYRVWADLPQFYLRQIPFDHFWFVVRELLDVAPLELERLPAVYTSGTAAFFESILVLRFGCNLKTATSVTMCQAFRYALHLQTALQAFVHLCAANEYRSKAGLTEAHCDLAEWSRLSDSQQTLIVKQISAIILKRSSLSDSLQSS